MSKTPVDYFTQEAAQGYDARNSKLSAISDCMHFLTSLLLKDLPARSRILCAGVGTGAELLALARIFPEWQFVALDPSNSMLEICRERTKAEGFDKRCEFVNGFVSDLPHEANFHAALSFLVGHFVARDQRLNFYKDMIDRLQNDGYLVNAEISFDLNSKEFPAMLRSWEKVQSLMGGTPESLAKLPALLRDTLTVIPPLEVEDLIQKSGIDIPLRFFQAFMICAWYGKKEKRA